MTLPLPDAAKRLVYLGTPDVAVPTLTALITAGFDIPLVVTRPDARRGRGSATSPSPVKAEAMRLGLAVSHDVHDVISVDADLGVVVAYGRLIPNAVLDVVPMVNIHFSLLPRWRGAAPVERALVEGDTETGVCLMDVVEGLDEGDVFASRRVAIEPEATLTALRGALIEVGTQLLLDKLQNGFDAPTPQTGDSTYAAKITKDELRLDFTAEPRRVRGLVALGQAWTTFRGKRFKVLDAHLVSGDTAGMQPGAIRPPSPESATPHVALRDAWLELRIVQPEGKAPMQAKSWAHGAHLRDDDRLGT